MSVSLPDTEELTESNLKKRDDEIEQNLVKLGIKSKAQAKKEEAWYGSQHRGTKRIEQQIEDEKIQQNDHAKPKPPPKPQIGFIIHDKEHGGLKYSDTDSTGSGYTISTGPGGLHGSVISKEDYKQDEVSNYADLPGLPMVHESFQDNWDWYMMTNANFKQMVGTGSAKIEFRMKFTDLGIGKGVKWEEVDKQTTFSLTKKHEYDFIVIKQDPNHIRFLDQTLAVAGGAELAGHTTMLSVKEWDICYKNIGKPSQQTRYVLYAGKFTVCKDTLKICSWSNDSGHFTPWKKNADVFAHQWGLDAQGITKIEKGAHQQIYDMLQREAYFAAKREAFRNELGYNYYDDGYSQYDYGRLVGYGYGHDGDRIESQTSIVPYHGYDSYKYTGYGQYGQRYNYETSQMVYVAIIFIMFAILCCICGVVFGAIGSFIFCVKGNSKNKSEVCFDDNDDDESQSV